MSEQFDIIVIGAGHAGIEASRAASSTGCTVGLVTMDKSKAGAMACNPSVGGPAKGHITREIDALGGLMGIAADQCATHRRMLNTSKGPAVRALRVQVDKASYQQFMLGALESMSNVTIIQGEVEGLSTSEMGIDSVVIGKEVIKCKAVILATGTFLRGEIHIGDERFPAGRLGEDNSTKLCESLEELGLRFGRLKTGTTPRIHKDTLDSDRCELQPDETGHRFSHMHSGTDPVGHLPCFITRTNADTASVIKANMHLSALFSGAIEGTGPRYCPSIEDKIAKFPDRESHPVFLEYEGMESPSVYLQGLSTSLPKEVQEKFVRTIPGLENAEIITSGYAIEYDYLDPAGIPATLERPELKGLYVAGQINGTSGYEEAAAQGLVAGVNAALKLRGKEPFILGRDEAYIGVLVDDLVTKGTTEPYRMFTSRCEFRLLLRFDNADIRLTAKGRELGLVDDDRWNVFTERMARLDSVRKVLEGRSVDNEFLDIQMAEKISRPLSEWLRQPELGVRDLINKGLINETLDTEDDVTIESEYKYTGYLARQRKDISRMKKMESVVLESDFSYDDIKGLSYEGLEKLKKLKPGTLGQAGRIAGITPADIAILAVHLGKAGK